MVITLSRLYLIKGAEAFLKKQYLEEIKLKFKKGKPDWVNFETYFADQDEISKITQTTSLFPSHSQFRVSIIKNIDKIPSDSQNKLLNFLNNIPAQSTIILVTSDEDIDNNFMNKLSKLSQLEQIICEPLNYRNLYSWISDRVEKKANKRISKQAISILLEKADTNLFNLNNEIEKLILYSRNDESVEFHHVSKLVERNVQYNVFKLIDYICDKDIAKAIDVLNQMFEYDIPAVKIIGALGWQLRKMLRGKVLLVIEKVSPFKMTRRLGISRYFADKFIGQVNNFSLFGLRKGISKLAYIDVQIKKSNLPPKLALEKFIVELTE